MTRLELPLADPPSRTVFEERAKKDNAVGYHAKVQLARLDRNEPLKSKVDYVAQTWAFGDSLAMAFLPGEVVVDYVTLLEKALGPNQLWLAAYCNDVFGYLPSARVLKEGGYEGESAMLYYGLPSKWAPPVEELIVRKVHQLANEVSTPK